MEYKREDFPMQAKHLIVEFPELCEAAPKAKIAALKAAVAKHNKAIDAKLKDSPLQRRSAG